MARHQGSTIRPPKAAADSRRRNLSKPDSKRLKAPNLNEEISRDSVTAHALATFGSSEKAHHWMNRPNPLFHGKTPAQVIEFDLVGVEAELVRIDHGVYM